MYLFTVILILLPLVISRVASNKIKQKSENLYYYEHHHTVQRFLNTLVTKKIIKKLYHNNSKKKKEFWIKNRSVKDEVVVSGIDFSFIHYRGYSFSNIIFQDCKFSRSVFENCDFVRVKFKNCDFSKTTKHKKEFNTLLLSRDYDLIGSTTIFNICEFTSVEFCNSTSLHSSIFYKCEFFINAKFNSIDMKFSNFIECAFYDLKINNSNLGSMKIIKPSLCSFNISIDSEIKGSVIDDYTYIDKFVVKSGFKRSALLMLSDFYFQIANICYSSNLMKSYSMYYYLSRYYSKKAVIDSLEKIGHHFNDFICGFGEKPSRTLKFGIILILLFSLVYMHTGLLLPDESFSTNYDFNITYINNFFANGSNPFVIVSNLLWLYIPEQYIKDFGYCLYFSIVTFTTVGFGDITPIGYSRLFSSLEMLCGVTIAGLWTATLARKMMR